jgi:hypothetical protein
VGAYSASKQNSAAKKAAAQQQAGVDQARQFSQEAADAADKKLSPVADLFGASLPGLQQTAQQYQTRGATASNNLQAAAGAPLDVKSYLDPSMAFAQEQGQKAIESSVAARGLAKSGAALKSIAKFSNGLASQNWSNATNLAMQDRQQRASINQGLAGQGDTALNLNNSLFNTGVNAVGQQANIIGMQGTNNSNLAMTSANVGAAATAAQKDVLGSAIGGAAEYYFSDEELKYGKEGLTDAEIDAFMNELEPKSYDYKAEAKAKGAPEGRQIGVMAQDMQKSKIGKRLVKMDAEGDRMVDVPQTVSALLATTAVLNKRIQSLEGKKSKKGNK